MYPTIAPDKNFRQLQGSRTTPNRHINEDSMASQSPDMSSGIISVFMDDDGTFTYNTDLVPPPKTTNCMRHTMTQHDSPAKVFAKLKSQIQRERHHLTEVASNHPAFGSNLLPKPHLSCEKRVSEDEVLDLKRDQELKNIGSSTVRRRLIKGQGCCPQMEKPTAAVYKENYLPDTATMGLGFGSVLGNALPYNLDMTASRADGPDSQTPVTADPLLCHNLPQTCISNKSLWVKLEKLPQMSPAKLFVHIKENERNRRIHKAGCGTTTIHRRGPFQPQDRSTSTAFHKDVMELKSSMGDVRCVPGSADPISESKLEGADDPVEDFQPVVVDPLLVSSPSICFRKKREGVFKWPAKPSKKRPQKGKVIGVYLTRWLLKSNSAGLYVDGILKDDKQPWHSSVIVERLSNTVLKTSSGNTYILVGRMAMSMNSELPQWLLKKYADGFPEDWRMIYDKFKSESIREKSSKVVNQSVKPQRTNVRPKAVSCTPTYDLRRPPTSSAKTSRSGRVIIAPLDYWRGGRVIVDKDMNMTIHDSYETTVSLPEVQAEVTVSRSNREEDTVSNASEMAPLRKVKPPPRHYNGARAKPAKQTGGHNEPLNTDLSIPEGFSRRSTSIAGITAMQPTLYTDGVPEANSNRCSRQRSKNPKRLSTKKGNPPGSSDPPTSDQASDADSCAPLHSQRKGTKALDADSWAPPHSQRKGTKASDADSWAPPHSQRKGTKAFGETGSKARKDVKEDDEDQWSEAELARLKKAVNLFPNHLGSFWDKVAQMVATRSAEECQREHMSQGVVVTGRTKRTKTSRKKEPVNETEPPKITAGVGTLKRKQQVRQLIKAMPKEDYDDAFTNASMFANVYQFPATLPSDESDDEFVFPGLASVTPRTSSSSGFPTVKTPLCHHITEDMLGSVDRDNDDRSVYRLQKRMKKFRANVRCAVKDIKVKPSEKRRLIGEHNSFLVKETRPDSESAESGEEEDFYFDLD